MVYFIIEKANITPKWQTRGNAGAQSRASEFMDRQTAEVLDQSQVEQSAWDFFVAGGNTPANPIWRGVFSSAPDEKKT